MQSDLAQVWEAFSRSAGTGYSPLYTRICRSVAADDTVLALVAEAPARAHFPLMLLAAVHYLVLGGLDHPLVAVYSATSDADPGPLFADVCLSHRDEILDLLSTRHVNTNEVGRSALLAPALTTVAARTARPLAFVDVGCSAGLNLRCDAYRIEYGDAGTTGPADAPVRVSCDVVGGTPPIESHVPEIATRVGLDLDPVTLDDDGIRWLLACVWPDTGRLPRTRIALDELRRDPPRVVAGDAVDAVTGVVADLPRDTAVVLTTTWALAYLPRDRRLAFSDTLTELSRARPIWWVSAEGHGVVQGFADVDPGVGADGMDANVLGLVTFRDGAATPEVLGFVHPHGAWIDWRAD